MQPDRCVMVALTIGERCHGELVTDERKENVMTLKPVSLLWVCSCCLFAAVNGDETGCRDYHGHRDGDENHPDGLARLLKVDDSHGLLDEEHVCGIPYNAPVRECDCERLTYSRLTCDGCGGKLAGERHGFTRWTA